MTERRSRSGFDELSNHLPWAGSTAPVAAIQDVPAGTPEVRQMRTIAA